MNIRKAMVESDQKKQFPLGGIDNMANNFGNDWQ